MCSGSSCVGTAQRTFYYPKSACSSLACSSAMTAMTYKIGTKALSAILDAMKLIRSPSVDSCSEYDPNDYSNLEESKADGLSCSPIKVPALIWQGFIDCAYLAYVVLHFFYFVAPPSA